MPKVGVKSGASGPKPYWATPDGELVRLYLGDVVDVLKGMPAKSVHMAVTSPPYWGLRDYGTAIWEGGDPKCDHKRSVGERAWDAKVPKPGYKSGFRGSESRTDHREEPAGAKCSKCGAVRVVDNQIGSEETPEEFIAKMVKVFHEVKRVLRDDGTLWLNLGDTYVGGDLAGIPWQVALALKADGWVLRQEIIWHKPSPMPESVTNRCTKAHEQVFLLTKHPSNYFCDMVAIREVGEGYGRGEGPAAFRSKRYINNNAEDNQAVPDEVSGSHKHTYEGGRNKRDVWTVASFAYPGAHFATFPPKLIEPCILAGTSAKGCCAQCGAPWKRITKEVQLTRERPNDYVKRTGEEGSCSNSVAGVEIETVGWEPMCECEAGVKPCIVLDPFIGSGTTCDVSIQHGRNSIGIDLSEKYLKENAIERIDAALAAKPILREQLGYEGTGLEYAPAPAPERTALIGGRVTTRRTGNGPNKILAGGIGRAPVSGNATSSPPSSRTA